MTAAKTFNPAADFDSHELEQSRIEEGTTFKLDFDETIVIESDDQTYSLWVVARLKRLGSRGAMEIEACDKKEIHLHVLGFEEPVQLDTNGFYKAHPYAYMRLQNKVDLYLFRKAYNSKDWTPV
ncbi:MAG: hypothetical protein EOP06_09900 [Proteobacteria bacterium]|nr:MAG: hypothetical protein EOP06_09900 [Pseudomonadota bacterium]